MAEQLCLIGPNGSKPLEDNMPSLYNSVGANNYAMATTLDLLNREPTVTLSPARVDNAINRGLRLYSKDPLGAPTSIEGKTALTKLGKTDLIYALAQHRLDKEKYPDILPKLARAITDNMNNISGSVLRDIVATVGSSLKSLMVSTGSVSDPTAYRQMSAYTSVGNLGNMFRHYMRPFSSIRKVINGETVAVPAAPKFNPDHILSLMAWDKKELKKKSEQEIYDGVLELLENSFNNSLNDPSNILPLLERINTDKSNHIKFSSEIQDYLNRSGGKGKNITYYMFGNIYPKGQEAAYEGFNPELEYNIFMHNLSRDSKSLDQMFVSYQVADAHRQQVRDEIAQWIRENRNKRMSLEKEVRSREKAWKESQLPLFNTPVSF